MINSPKKKKKKNSKYKEVLKLEKHENRILENFFNT